MSRPGPTGPDDTLQTGALPGLPPDVVARAQALRGRLDAIMNAQLSPEEELPQLTPRMLERVEAFALRNELRGPR